MSSLKWQLTILDEKDIDRKGQCVINPAGTAVRWRPVHFFIKGFTKNPSFFILWLMGKKKMKYICQPIEDVLARIKKSKKIIDNFYIEDHLYDRPNQCSLYYLKKHIQFVIDYDKKYGLSINVYKNDCFIEWAAKKNAECVARGILRWLRLGDIGNSQESLVIKEMKRNNIQF